MTKIINLFCGPGGGKSTTAAGVFALSKLHGLSIELSTEYAKDVTHKEAFKILKDQLYVLGKQSHRQFIVKDKYDFVVTDSPILLSAVYADSTDKKFIDFVFDRFNSQDNMNFLIRRVKPYVTVGRSQSEKEAMLIDTKIQMLLENNNVPFEMVKGDFSGINHIVEKLLSLKGVGVMYKIV